MQFSIADDSAPCQSKVEQNSKIISERISLPFTVHDSTLNRDLGSRHSANSYLRVPVLLHKLLLHEITPFLVKIGRNSEITALVY